MTYNVVPRSKAAHAKRRFSYVPGRTVTQQVDMVRRKQRKRKNWGRHSNQRQFELRKRRAHDNREKRTRDWVSWFDEHSQLLRQHWQEGSAVCILRDEAEHPPKQIAKVHRQALGLSKLFKLLSQQQEEYIKTAMISYTQCELKIRHFSESQLGRSSLLSALSDPKGATPRKRRRKSLSLS